MYLVSELCSPIVPVARVCLLDQTANLVLLLVGGPFSMIQGRVASKSLFHSHSTHLGAPTGLTTPMALFLLLMKH